MAAMRKECPVCGHITCVYSHHLNRALVSALRQLVDFYESTRNPANLQKNLSLTKNQYNNFQKLQYFNLVHRAGSSGWVPSMNGMRFIHGEMRIRNTALTFGRQILSYDHEAWQDRKYRLVGVVDIDATSYKKPEAYKAEKSGPAAQLSFWG